MQLTPKLPRSAIPGTLFAKIFADEQAPYCARPRTVSRLAAALCDGLHVMVYGLGGMGKSILHRAVAIEVGRLQPGIRLATVHAQVYSKQGNPIQPILVSDVIERVYRALGGPAAAAYVDLRAKLVMIAARPKAHDTLFVFDGIETFAPEELRLFRELLEHLPVNCMALVLARQYIDVGIPAEVLAPLTVEEFEGWVKTACRESAAIAAAFAHPGARKRLYAQTFGIPSAIAWMFEQLQTQVRVEQASYHLIDGPVKRRLAHRLWPSVTLSRADREILAVLELFAGDAPFGALRDILAMRWQDLEAALRRMRSLALIGTDAGGNLRINPLVQVDEIAVGLDLAQLRQRFIAYWVAFVFAHSDHPSELAAQWSQVERCEQVLWDEAIDDAAQQLRDVTTGRMLVDMAAFLIPYLADQRITFAARFRFHSHAYRLAELLGRWQAAAWQGVFVAVDLLSERKFSEAEEVLSNLSQTIRQRDLSDADLLATCAGLEALIAKQEIPAVSPTTGQSERALDCALGQAVLHA